MPGNTLSDILLKIRRVCGCGDPLSVSDDRLKGYVDSAYSYELPALFRTLQLQDIFTFETEKNIAAYPFDQKEFISPGSPAFIAKREGFLFLDKPPIEEAGQLIEKIGAGNGTAGPYLHTASPVPFLRSVSNNPSPSQNPGFPAGRQQNILITTEEDETQNVSDDGFKNLIQKTPSGYVSAGTVDYDTGAISVSFAGPVASGKNIFFEYFPFKPSLPQNIYFYQNKFFLSPVPDKGYTVEITCRRTPSRALFADSPGSGIPELNEWWEWLAFSGAKKFFEENMDTEGVSFCMGILEEKKNIMEKRVYARVSQSRIEHIFTDHV